MPEQGVGRDTLLRVLEHEKAGIRDLRERSSEDCQTWERAMGIADRATMSCVGTAIVLGENRGKELFMANPK